MRHLIGAFKDYRIALLLINEAGLSFLAGLCLVASLGIVGISMFADGPNQGPQFSYMEGETKIRVDDLTRRIQSLEDWRQMNEQSKAQLYEVFTKSDDEIKIQLASLSTKVETGMTLIIGSSASILILVINTIRKELSDVKLKKARQESNGDY